MPPLPTIRCARPAEAPASPRPSLAATPPPLLLVGTFFCRTQCHSTVHFPEAQELCWARSGCAVVDVMSFVVTPILRLAIVLDDIPMAVAVLRRLVLPPLPGVVDAPDDLLRAPRGLRSGDEAATLADLARWWGLNARREKLAVLRQVLSESGRPSIVAVPWLAAELSRERFETFPDGAAGSSAAGVTMAAHIICATAARVDVFIAVAAVSDTFLPSFLATDMAGLFSSVTNGNVSSVPPHASLMLADTGRLAVSGLVNVSPAMIPQVTRLLANSLSLGDKITLLILNEKLSCRQEAIALQMVVVVLPEGPGRWHTPLAVIGWR